MPPVLPIHTRRLSELVNRPGGITADEAVKAAEARLDTIRDASLNEIAKMVDQLQSIGTTMARSPSFPVCDDLYAVSNSLVGVAGVFGLPELGEVAFSLCKLLDRQRSSGSWNAEMINLHLSSMRLMSGEASDPTARQTVVQALHQVVDRVYSL